MMIKLLSLLTFLYSVLACANTEVVAKNSCNLDVDYSNMKSIYIDKYKIDLAISDLKVGLVNSMNGSMNIVLLSSDKQSVIISVKQKDKDLLVEARDYAINSPVGNLAEFAELYGSSPFGMGVNTIYESSSYSSFLVVETGENGTRSTNIIGSNLPDSHLLKISVSPSLSCNQISITEPKLTKSLDKDSAVFKLKSLVFGFLQSGNLKGQASLIGMAL